MPCNLMQELKSINCRKEIIKINFMFRRNRLRKSLFFVLMFIILTQCGSFKNPEAVEDISKVEQREDV